MKEPSIRVTKYFVWITAIIFLAMLSWVNIGDYVYIPDLRFLWNRVVQLRSCYSDGNFGFFFYKDFEGVGYGSSFFYGYLTLIPFIGIKDMGLFIRIFYMVVMYLNYFGACFLFKRFTRNNELLACLYVGSVHFIELVTTNGVLANLYAVGISLFFLGYCIDFFRDKKNFYKATITYFLLLNTHLITSVFSFIFCITIMIYYFDKARLKEYTLFAITTVLVCSYNIANILHHFDVVNATDRINSKYRDYYNSGLGLIDGCYLCDIPVGGAIAKLLGVSLKVSKINMGIHLFDLVTALILLIYVIKAFAKYNIKAKLMLIFAILGIIIGEVDIWFLIISKHTPFFQFPIRYSIYIVLFLLLFGFRNLKNKKIEVILLSSCLVLPILTGFCTARLTDEQIRNLGHSQVGNGEYLDKSFSWNRKDFDYKKSGVHDEEGNSYSYTENKGVIIVDLSSNTKNLVLTFPKLYYRGYSCIGYSDKNLTSRNKTFAVEKGDSQFIKVRVKDYRGYLKLQYTHPLWLIVLYAFSLGLVFLLSLTLVYKMIRKTSH